MTVRCLAVLAFAVLPFLTLAAKAQESPEFPAPILKQADPNEKGDGTLGSAAKAAIEHGPLPMSEADVAAKAAANRERDEAEKKTGRQRPFSPVPPTGPLAIAVGLNAPGLPGGLFAPTPADATGAIGPTRYIQLVNSQPVLLTPTHGARIFDRTGSPVVTGSLNDLAETAFDVNTFDPQIIWDPSTVRFYYAMDAVFSSTDNRLAFGFSKTAEPGNFTTDWCHYTLSFGAKFPDYPKLGGSLFFMIIGVNNFVKSAEGENDFIESQIVTILKPPFEFHGIRSCPDVSKLTITLSPALRDTQGNLVFTPVPAQQIDDSPTGYVVARQGFPWGGPWDKLWFFSMWPDTAGAAHFEPVKGITVPAYTIPAAASQSGATQVLDTSDARNTQAVQAMDPSLGKFAFWTQHTIKDGTFSVVRWYEFDLGDPVGPLTPVLLHSGTAGVGNAFAFNGAISPDRARHLSVVGKFGDRFLIEFNSSSQFEDASIFAASGVNGHIDSFRLVEAGVAPYTDATCPISGNTCRWGDYSAASPDPTPGQFSTSHGVVWGTNQWGQVRRSVFGGNEWRTRIFALEP
jgi:hypothetical protein